MKPATLLSSTPLSTSKHYADTIAVGSRGRAFNVEDLVLCLVHSNMHRHKLSLPWEGSYIITEVLKPGTYKLKTTEGQVVANFWNIEQLRRFYP
jgi:hypothetical protein